VEKKSGAQTGNKRTLPGASDEEKSIVNPDEVYITANCRVINLRMVKEQLESRKEYSKQKKNWLLQIRKEQK